MKTPKTPNNFPYDLWITQDGTYMVRIKQTGEIVVVSHEVMKELRREEKADRRDVHVENDENYTLSLDCALDSDKGESWMTDPHDMQEDVITKIMEEEFCKSLTGKQLDVYLNCLKLQVKKANMQKHTMYPQLLFVALRSCFEKNIKNFSVILKKRRKNVRCQVKGIFDASHEP